MPSSNGQRECTVCPSPGIAGAKLHCIHFDGRVIHWHEPVLAHETKHHVCGPDNAHLCTDGQTVHLDGVASFTDAADAEAEFDRRNLALMGREA